MIGIADPGQAEAALAAGTLACPGCTRPLRPWGHARARTVRDHGHATLALRPRRARCRTCRVTHALLPAVVTPRPADTTAVIGSALLASARGTGYRQIALQLDRPLSTVRRWIRAVGDPDHIAWLRAQAVDWLAQVDRDVLGGLRPEATRLAAHANAMDERHPPTCCPSCSCRCSGATELTRPLHHRSSGLSAMKLSQAM
jgi:Domain of unknown function (DUF6431)